MAEALTTLERIARNAHRFTETDHAAVPQHPFVARDIHEALPARVRGLFDDGHYAEATYTAYKYLDGEVRRLSGIAKTGRPLMMDALNGDTGAPAIKLTALGTISEKDEQEGQVQDGDAAVIEIACFTGCHRRAAAAGDGRDLSVEVSDGASELLPGGGDFRKHRGGVRIEREDAAREVFLEHSFDGGLQRRPPLALW